MYIVNRKVNFIINNVIKEFFGTWFYTQIEDKKRRTLMDFFRVMDIRQNSPNSRVDYKIGVDFLYGEDLNIVCKGGGMYAFWYDNKWNTNFNDLIRLIDSKILLKASEITTKQPNVIVQKELMSSHNSGIMERFIKYTKQTPQSDIQFNKKILFSDDIMKKEDYATTQLNYTPSPGETPAFDELTEVLYDEQELDKILWFMGALLTNNMKHIQKFLYLYGGKGTGKGTIIQIFKMLFADYSAPIDLANLTSDNAFATSEIQEVPLLIDDDTDLSNIKKDTNLLKLTAHEPIIINSKYKTTYVSRFEGLLITASNQRYKVRNIDSGITRRAVVVEPTNRTHTPKVYNNLMSRVKYELAMIAHKAIEHYEKMGAAYYEDYVDYDMIEATDHFYAFVRENALGLGDPCTLKRASELYKLYLEDMGWNTGGYKKKVRNELQRYYNYFYDAKKINDKSMKNVFEGMKWDIAFPDKTGFANIKEQVTEESMLKKLNIGPHPSAFNETAKDYPAQLAKEDGTPTKPWDYVTTTLNDIDTKALHYVRLPLQHIIIDFDKTKDGEKNLAMNLKAVEKFPETYLEISRSGGGVHLHYIYAGDVSKLDDRIDEDIEVKVYTGKSSLRRKLTMCNDIPIATISSGLPIKEEKLEVYKDIEVIKLNEQKMRAIIKGNLNKKYHTDTRSSVDFIIKIFEDAKREGVKYDLRDMRQDILNFAISSTNQSSYCVKAVSGITFNTLESEDATDLQQTKTIYDDEEIYFFDVEVFSNLFVLVYKKFGDPKMYSFINPTPEDVEIAVGKPLVGFNNRRYDNHIMYARLLGEDNMSLYRQSQRIINRKDGGSGMYGAAYELSYTDIYDYSSAANKMSLKKWEVKLGIKHDEFELPWDKPVPKEQWNRVVEYCENDVLATEAVFNATKSDYRARIILSSLSELSMNSTTNQHTTKIVFEGNRNTQNDLVYTDLSEMFPGYSYDFGVSSYKGEDPGEGGYVYAEPGVYIDVGLYDIGSMHPYSIIALNAFGKYTKNFKALVDARMAIKHKDYISVESMFDGKLKPYLGDENLAYDLANALKTAINSAYGLTKAGFDNPFKHNKNVDNIVAKRGALFMIDLKHAVQEQGYQVAHIKTDSIKIPNADDKIRDFIFEFGKKYDYIFEHEDTYEKLALVNKAAYVCKNVEGVWSGTGTQFKDSYVFKRLFTKEDIVKEDFFVAKEVKNAAIYLGDTFIGKFAELYASKTGEQAFRKTEDKEGYLAGTKGFRWELSAKYKGRTDVDLMYYEGLVDQVIEDIEKVGDKNDILE